MRILSILCAIWVASPVVGLEILSREAWEARPAVTERAVPLRNISKGPHRVAAENTMPRRAKARYLTVHHTARRASDLPLAENLRAFQGQLFDYQIEYGNGVRKRVVLGDLPYHFFIDKAGRIGEGRELRYAAYSNTIYDTPILQHITVVLDGNFERTPPTGRQLEALEALLAKLARDHDIPAANIAGHKHVAQTLCPGKYLEAELPGIIARIARQGG